jgi:hypothetical protein
VLGIIPGWRSCPVGISLSHRALATPVAGRAQCTLTRSLGAQCFLHTLVRPVYGLDVRCVKKQCGLVGLCFGGRMAFDLRLSRARTEDVAMRQVTTNNWIPRNWGEKGVNK